MPIYVTARSYKHYASDRFVNDLWQIPWFENALIDDANDKLEHFNVNFSTALARHAPVKTKLLQNVVKKGYVMLRKHISNEKSVRTMTIKVPCGKSSKIVLHKKKYSSILV